MLPASPGQGALPLGLSFRAGGLGTIKALAERWLPEPRVTNPWPSERFAVKYPGWEPVCGKSARTVLCGGAVMRVPTAIGGCSRGLRLMPCTVIGGDSR